jgi:hypothetical protein
LKIASTAYSLVSIFVARLTPLGRPPASRATSSTDRNGDLLCVTNRRWLSARITKPLGSPRSAMPSRLESTSRAVKGEGMSFTSSRYSKEARSCSVWASNRRTLPLEEALTANHLPLGATATP